MEDDDAIRTLGGAGEPVLRAAKPCVRHRPALMTVRANGIEPDDVHGRGGMGRLGRSPQPLELCPGPDEPRGRVGLVVVAGHGKHRRAEPGEKGVRALVLGAPAAVRQITGGDDQFRCHLLYQGGYGFFDLPILTRARMEVGEMEDSCGHGRLRVNVTPVPGPSRSPIAANRQKTGAWHRTTRIEVVPDESAEIFDDLYLGLRAGGAMRKQRRGEQLTTEEEEALGRWQRLSTARKAAAIGGFAIGTFGLGFTLGGLVFGRWRKA